MQLSPAIPLIRIFDEAKAREFYVDFLGFEFEWEHRFEPGLPFGNRLRFWQPKADLEQMKPS